MGTNEAPELLLSKLLMEIWPLKAEIFSRIFCCNPKLVANETNIITTPMAIAAIAIFIIGAEILLL